MYNRLEKKLNFKINAIFIIVASNFIAKVANMPEENSYH